MLDTKEKLMEYVGILSQDAFHDATVRRKHGRLEITAKLVGIPVQVFKPVRAPYTRQFLRHMPTQTPQELRPADDHKQAPKKRPRRKKAVRRVAGRHKG